MVYLNKKLPSISIVSVALNPRIELFEECVQSIKKQVYPNELIEHIVMDGGSSAEFIRNARRHGCKVYSRLDLRINAEERQHIGFKKAKGEIILVLETDNILSNKYWLQNMVRPFQENTDIVCTFPAWNCVEKKHSLLTRYSALFGVCDPVLHYLGKSEKLTWYQKYYKKGNLIQNNKFYATVSFDSKTLPVLGDNGCLFRKDVFLRSRIAQKEFVHLDLFADLLSLNFNTYGAVYECVSHITGSSVRELVKRRLLYSTVFTKQHRARKYLVFDPNSLRDVISVTLFIIFTISLIEPVLKSLRGYVRKPDVAWFLHPAICWVFLISYSIFEIRYFMKKWYEKIT